MAEKEKVAEAPKDVKDLKASEDEQLIDNRRAEIENLVIGTPDADPEKTPEKEPDEKPDEKPEESKTPIDKIKKSVQKRIDKVVAQKKSVEDQLAETRAELEKLKSKPEEPSKSDDPPTADQVEAYIVRMREEGNTQEEIKATRYLIKLEKETALKEVRESQEKERKEAESIKKRQLADWTDLQKDYAVYDDNGKLDMKSELNLANQKGILYTTALDLYNDKDLHADFYNDPDTIKGFRRAVADAYREIHQQGLIKNTKETKISEIVRDKKLVLAEPDSDGEEDPVQSGNQNFQSDSDRVREEIKRRRQPLRKRTP